MFFAWLITQRDRTDFVGRFAQRANADKKFPRHTNKLHALLQHYQHDGHQRTLAKMVHREYRQSKRQQFIVDDPMVGA